MAPFFTAFLGYLLVMLHSCCRAASNRHSSLWGQCSYQLITQLQPRKQLLCSLVFTTAVALINTLQYITWISEKWAYVWVCMCIYLCLAYKTELLRCDWQLWQLSSTVPTVFCSHWKLHVLCYCWLIILVALE